MPFQVNSFISINFMSFHLFIQAQGGAALFDDSGDEYGHGYIPDNGAVGFIPLPQVMVLVLRFVSAQTCISFHRQNVICDGMI